MADNVTLDPGTGGAVISTEEVTTLNGGAASAQHVQRMLLAFRTGDGTAVDAPRGGGVEADALRVTVASDSTGVLSVDDNGGSLTVDNAALSVVGGGAEATALRVTLASDSTGVVSVDDNGSTLSVDDGAGSLTVDNATLSVTGSGVEASALRVTVASDSTGVLSVDDNGGSLTVDVGTALPAGTNNIGDVDVLTLPGSLAGIADDAAFTPATSVVLPVGYFADQTSTDSVNEGDVGAARMTLDRKQIVTVAPSADTEGWDTKNCTSGDGSTALTNTAQAIKATAGKLGGWYIYNPNSSAAYVPIYNVAAASVTVGTTNPQMVLTIPASSAANLEMVNGIAFDTAISVAAATTAAGNGAPTSALEANFFYK